jgi:enamine deaminase RidA (YjgF/YER057c/UK114 family)
MTEIVRLVDIPGLSPTRSLAYATVVTAGDLVFIAGQAGLTEQGQLVSPEFVPQARRTFENIEVALEAAGATLGQVVTMTVFLTDWRYGDDFLRVRAEFLGDDLAASATIGIGQLAQPEMLVEVQCVAVRSQPVASA